MYCVLEHCGVGIFSPFKAHLRNSWNDWSIQKYGNLPSTAALPVPTRKDISSWVKDAWGYVSTPMVKRTFKHIGFFDCDPEPTAVAHPEHHFSMGGSTELDEDVDIHDEN